MKLKRSFLSGAKFTLTYILALLFVLNPVTALATDEPKIIDSDTYEAMFKLGVSNVEFFYAAFQPPPAAQVSNADIKVSLESVADSYKHTVTTKRGAVGLLNNTIDVALAGTDFASGGTAFVATVPIRWAKSIGVEKLIGEIDKEAVGVFAKNIDQIKTHTGLEYEQLQALPPEQIALKADSIPEIHALKTKLRGEGLAEEVVDKFVIDTVTNVQKATLMQVAQNTSDINALGKGLENATRAMAKYFKENNARLDNLTGRIDEVEADLRQAAIDIDNLKEVSKHNTQQINLIGDVLFSSADPSHKLVMLNNGYLDKRLPTESIEGIKRSLETEVKKRELLGKMNEVVSDFNKIGTIVNNLGIDAPELNEAINVANSVAGAISSFATGDYLGAIAGITGLFGSKTDANAERHKQLMNYLKQQFAEVNRKLDQIIEGQQRIMEGIVELSKQMAAYDRALHQRLDRIEDKIDSLENKTYTLLYANMGNCSETYKVIRQDIGIVDSTRLAALRRINPANAGRVIDCGEYMRSLFNSAFNPDIPALQSLALTNSAAAGTPAPYRYKPEDVETYYQQTDVKNFLDNYYKKVEAFVLSRSTKAGWSVPHLLAALSLPSVNTKGLKTKMAFFDEASNACDSKSKLSDPMIALVCGENNRLRLPVVSGAGLEARARDNGLRVLRTPALYDAVNSLSEWSLFYAPIYDVTDFENRTISSDYFAMLKEPSYRPEGKGLLQGAARINSAALAQMNMVQGDITAKFIFDLLWDPSTKTFLPESQLTSDEQKQALAILKLDNPHILRNVLMLAMDSSAKMNGPGVKHAYKNALDSAHTYSVDAFAAFKPIFGTSIKFKNRWLPTRDDANEADRAKCNAADSTQKPPEVMKSENGEVLPIQPCSSVPLAIIYDMVAPLPTSEEFNDREFSYPNSLLQMVNYRDRLATRLADYDFLEWAVKDSPDKNAARKKLVNALMSSTK